MSRPSTTTRVFGSTSIKTSFHETESSLEYDTISSRNEWESVIHRLLWQERAVDRASLMGADASQQHITIGNIDEAGPA
eukprot:scaffold95229_cov37-Prasinocladus_malaysianus.AAC.1